MKHFYLTSLVLALMSVLPASGQVNAKEFPLSSWGESILKSAPQIPYRTPQAIDDKTKGVTMYVGQFKSENKKRRWVKFRTGNASDLITIKNFTPANDQTQQHGLLCGAYDGKDYYAIFNESFTYSIFPVAFAKMNVANGDTTNIYKFSDAEKQYWYSGHDVYTMAYDNKTKSIYALGKDYETQTINGEEVTVGFSVLFTINKNTGKFNKVKIMDRVYYNLCFDYNGDCYMVRPKAKSEDDPTTVGTELVKFDSDFNISGAPIECKSEWGESFLMYYFGTMSFNHTTGDLYWIPVGRYGATTIYTVNTETGIYTPKSWFHQGNSFVGLCIPYMTAENAKAPAQVSNIDAQADISGLMVDTIKWTNPTKAWDRTPLTEMKEVLIYRKKQNIATTELTPTETLLSATNADLLATIPALNKMGEAMQWVDNNPNEGINTYYVVASNANGEKGVPDSIRCYMGLDVPGAVQNIQIKKKGTGIELSWETPTKGLNNGYIKEAELTYTLTRLPDNVVVATDLNATTYTDNTLGDQQKYSYKIQAKNSVGEGEIAESEGIMAGSALTTPINLRFDNQDDANRWYSPTNHPIYFYYCGGYDEDSKCMIGYSNYQEADGFITSPPLKLEAGKTYRITTDFYVHQRDTEFDLKISVGKNGEDLTDATVIKEEKNLLYPEMYHRVVYEDMFTAPTTDTYYYGLQVATHKAYNNFRLYGLNVDYVAENDLKAFSIDNIKEAVVAYDNKCTVKVRNVGSKTQSNYGIKIYCIDEGTHTLVGETKNVPELKSGETADVQVKFNPTKDGLFDFYGVVELEGDQDHSNDTTAVANIYVAPEGTTPWTNVVTSGKDEGQDTHGPSMNCDKYERTQSVYYASEINAEKGCEIKRLGYVYTPNSNLTDRTDPFDVKIYLAHTDLTKFTDLYDWLDEEKLTLVYDGTFTLEPGTEHVLSFNLQTPFEYDNTKNLIVVFDKTGAVPSELAFCALYKVFNSWGSTSNINRSLEYGGNAPFSQFGSQTYQSAPVLYLGIQNKTTGITNNVYVTGKNFSFDSNTGIITFNEDIKNADIYTTDGKLIKKINAEVSRTTKLNMPAGLYIVKTIADNGIVTSVKLNVK